MTVEEIVRLLSRTSGIPLPEGYTLTESKVYKPEGLLVPENIVLAKLEEQNKFIVTNIKTKMNWDTMELNSWENPYKTYIQGLPNLEIQLTLRSDGPIDINRLDKFFNKRVLYI